VDTTRSSTFKKVGAKAKINEWSYAYICWNMDGGNPFFNDVRVRKAMTHASNIEEWIRALTYNLNTPCYGIWHPDSPMFNKDVQLLGYDPKKAAALLDEAGWTVSPEDGWRYKDGVKFAFTMMVPNGAAASIDISALLQRELKRLGVQMDVQTIEWATFQERTRKHQFQASMAAWGTGTDPDTSWNIWHSTMYDIEGGRNYGGYKNARVDELFQLARNDFDENRRMAYYAEMQKIIYDEQPYTFVWNRPVLWAFNKRIRGVTFSPRGVWNFDPSYLGWWVQKQDQMHGMR
jgi:peptide/nickel transport system substrate-binding protein